jgi:hypothetical protein
VADSSEAAPGTAIAKSGQKATMNPAARWRQAAQGRNHPLLWINARRNAFHNGA